MTTGKKLIMLRNQNNFTQEELFKTLQRKYHSCDITREDIANWETGRHYPGWAKAKILVRFFGITLDDLFFDEKTEFLKTYKPKNQLKVA